MIESGKYILWDWNGTLLDDVRECINSMNIMLGKRDLPLIDREHYRDIFTFPVIDYYRKLGFDFDKEPFSELAPEYISLYAERSHNAGLHKGVVSVLTEVEERGFSQFILSAMEQDELLTQTAKNGIDHYFKEIVGLDNIHAKSKIEQGKKLIEKRSISADRCVMIGDTYHDYEVAVELGCRCILIDNGHQNLRKFDFEDSCLVIDDIRSIARIDMAKSMTLCSGHEI